MVNSALAQESRMTPDQGPHRIVDLKAGAHVMLLDAGIYCIFQAPNQPPVGPGGLPGARITRAAGVHPDLVQVSTFEEDGWIGGPTGAALVRVVRGPAGVMITTYQEPSSTHPGPRLQVLQLLGGVALQPSPGDGEASGNAGPQPDDREAKARQTDSPSANPVEVNAHIQRQGDVGSVLGQWIGERGSKLWIEGFEILPPAPLGPEDIEYQAVLGKGWLSPWAEGGQFCGSRGMSLPILGLNVRLRGEAAKKWRLDIEAAFTDGSVMGPVEGGIAALEAPSFAPLEAFRVMLTPIGDRKGGRSASAEESRRQPGGAAIEEGLARTAPATFGPASSSGAVSRSWSR